MTTQNVYEMSEIKRTLSKGKRMLKNALAQE